jgi:Holliday junction resolvase RusA-like endonuclease
MIEVVFPGRPYPWPRHRMGKGRSYMPAKQKKWLDDLALTIRVSAGRSMLSGPVVLRAVFDYLKNETRFEISPSDKKSHRIKRGDIDNLCKGLMEALQVSGVVKDDAQVAFLIAEKVE